MTTSNPRALASRRSGASRAVRNPSPAGCARRANALKHGHCAATRSEPLKALQAEERGARILAAALDALAAPPNASAAPNKPDNIWRNNHLTK
jgi:hypothetical protein